MSIVTTHIANNAVRVSVIIPVFNHGQELAQCLVSIKNQAFQNFEIIIIDDGSDEPIGDVAGARVIRQENKGAPAARNRGFKESSGQYVLFCDADVVMRTDMLAKMSAVLDENPGVSYAYSSFKFGFKKFKLWEFDADKLREMPYIHTTSLMRREHFPGFDESLKRLQDWDLWLTMLEQGHVGKWIDETLFSVKSGGTMSRWRPSFFVGRDKAYQDAVLQVKRKHHLT
ncbi:MAG: glycosyltransferase family 2 protein [Parcubacteria group bacterium]|nr:glycosyltransferase family 2 protein [Parcubacteria group bacterium]